MEQSRKIMRKSIFTFLQNYSNFTTKAALLAFPFSASILISQALILSSSSSPSLLPIIQTRLINLFDAAGFPKSSEFFTILNQKLSQTLFTSLFTLPFTLTFFLFSKAYVIQSLSSPKPVSKISFGSILNPIFLTYTANSLVILASHATIFALFFVSFNVFDGLGLRSRSGVLFLSASGAVVYSIVLANVLVVCNLALVVAGFEGFGGYLATMKACVLIKERTPTALSLALPMNLGLALVEALFQYRVARVYYVNGKVDLSMVMEGVLVFYLYSILLVVETVVNVVFFKNCREGLLVDRLGRIALCGAKDEDKSYALDYASFKCLEELA